MNMCGDVSRDSSAISRGEVKGSDDGFITFRIEHSDWGNFFLRDPMEYVSSSPQPDDGNRFSFQNIVLLSF
jgi:hypothetical protein